ncbi:putative protein FAR1-RELATED SEQUENCE 10 [Glycine max]|nr:putative protein FAR1-RELATED SEQUENCE 10 [Glycine max]KAH1193796.1 putative protein FAR1-RELATED SEQUENCE 10 [Glycine max]
MGKGVLGRVVHGSYRGSGRDGRVSARVVHGYLELTWRETVLTSKLCFSFSLFRAALPLVRVGSSVERNGEGEGTGVKLCGGRWRQTRYAYGGLWVADVFECREDVLRWARSVAHENGFVAVILRSNTNTGSRGRTTFVLIGCERSGEYKCRKKEFIKRDTGTRKCGCPFKLRCKPVVGGEGWMVKLICGVHNHELAKSLVGHPYAGRLTKAEKTLIADMAKSMVKPRNILLTLKEHNANSCTTIKQIYNARSAFRSSIRGSDLEMQHLMKLLERDQYIYWHRIKDEDVVRDIFWCHPDSVKLVNACNLVFLIDSTYKTNRYRLPLLDFVGVTPTGMTFSAGFAYVEGERVNNFVWALQRF